MDSGEESIREFFDVNVNPIMSNTSPDRLAAWVDSVILDQPKRNVDRDTEAIDTEIEELKKKIRELESKKTANKRTFNRIKIQRNQELLKNLFETVIQDDGFICGGFTRVCCSENKDIIPSMDIDIYTKGKEQFEAISKRLELNGYFEKRSSETARTMQYSFSGKLPVQLIAPLTEGHVFLASDNVEEILNNFDFTVARVGITKESLEKNEAIADIDFSEDDSKNRLNIKNIHCPIAQIYRVSKYMEKGYWLPMKQTLKIVMDWETRPEDYKNKILEVVKKEDPTKEEIQELERLLHID